MADISKINAVAIGSVAKLDAVLAANIAKVNGLVFSTGPAFSGLLDTYTGAAAAYSPRRLNGQYTGAAMRVREDSGDTETDIGFDANGNLDTAAIATHCGSANGYVTKWYDQAASGGTGSGNVAEQTTEGSQPQIYNGSAVITENGKPAIDFDGSNDYLTNSTNLSLPSPLESSTVMVAKFGAIGTNSQTVMEAAYYARLAFRTTYLNGFAFVGYADTGTSGVVPSQYISHVETQQLVNINYDGGSANDKDSYTAFRNGSGQTITQGSGTSSMSRRTGVTIGARGSSHSQFTQGLYQEVILFDSNQDSAGNRSGIEGNVNAHFQIGNFGTPTSGLLSTYTGAAAAYSVRQLANTAALCMRVRRDNDDAEQDFGFDANGDLETAAIATFVGSGNNGYVSKWYDQSGNGNDAEKNTPGLQPQIYNGSAVITENGKPAVDFANDQLDTTISLTSNQTIATVVTSHLVGIETLFSSAGGVAMGRSGSSAFYQSSTSGDADNFYGSYTTDNQELHFVFRDGTTSANSFGRINQTEGALNINGTGDISGTLKIGQLQFSGYSWDGFVQEMIFWDNQSSNKTAIETDINDYFSIY